MSIAQKKIPRPRDAKGHFLSNAEIERFAPIPDWTDEDLKQLKAAENM
jgi:hypothetical protein